MVIFSRNGVEHIDLPQTEYCEREQPMYLGLFSEHYVSVRPLRNDDNIDTSMTTLTHRAKRTRSSSSPVRFLPSISQQQPSPFSTEHCSGSFGDTLCKLRPAVTTNGRTDMDNVIVEYDIGNYLDSKLDDFTKCQILENHWQPTGGFKFPISIHNKKGVMKSVT